MDTIQEQLETLYASLLATLTAFSLSKAMQRAEMLISITNHRVDCNELEAMLPLGYLMPTSSVHIARVEVLLETFRDARQKMYAEGYGGGAEWRQADDMVTQLELELARVKTSMRQQGYVFKGDSERLRLVS